LKTKKDFRFLVSRLGLLILFLSLVFIKISSAQTENQDQNFEEVHDTKKLDGLLNDYNKDKNKAEANGQAIGQEKVKDAELETPAPPAPQGAESENTADELEKERLSQKENLKIKKSAEHLIDLQKHGRGDNGVLTKTNYSEDLKIALIPLQKMSEKQLSNLLASNTEGTSAAPYFKRFPTLSLFAVRLIKDKEALPSLAKIADDQERLIYFTGVMLSTILVTFLLKRFFKDDRRSFIEAFGVWLARFIMVSTLRVYIIFYFFEAELRPSLKILFKTFF
jgi:Skp family chaperone for outer membrane proteins